MTLLGFLYIIDLIPVTFLSVIVVVVGVVVVGIVDKLTCKLD